MTGTSSLVEGLVPRDEYNRVVDQRQQLITMNHELAECIRELFEEGLATTRKGRDMYTRYAEFTKNFMEQENRNGPKNTVRLDEGTDGSMDRAADDAPNPDCSGDES